MKKGKRVLALFLTAILLLSATNITFAQENDIVEKQQIVEKENDENNQSQQQIEEAQNTENDKNNTLEQQPEENTEENTLEQQPEEKSEDNSLEQQPEEKPEDNSLEQQPEKKPEDNSLEQQPEEKPEDNSLEQQPEEKPEDNSLEQQPEEKPEDNSLEQQPEKKPEDNSLEQQPEENTKQEITKEDNKNDIDEEDKQKIEEQDIVIYNLGNYEMTVGNDPEKAEQLFEEDGSYTIELEDNAFFPYEVQFQYKGETTIEWFNDPDSTITIGGHTFSVHSENSDENAITQIGVTIDGKYIPAKPETKTFVHNPVSTFSLLPLEEKKIELDLNGYDRYDLNYMELSTIIGGEQIKDTDRVIWFSHDNDDYKKLDKTKTENIYNLLDKHSSYNNKFELIIGDDSQINPNNMRYIVSVKNFTTGAPWTSNNVKIYQEKDGKRSQLYIRLISGDSYSGAEEYQNIDVDLTGKTVEGDTIEPADKNTKYYIGGFEVTDRYKTMGDVKIYRGEFYSIEEIEKEVARDPSIDVTDGWLNKDISVTGGCEVHIGTPISKYYTTVFKAQNGNEFLQRTFLSISTPDNYDEIELYSIKDSNGVGIVKDSTSYVEGKVKIIKATVSETDKYYLKLKCYNQNNSSSTNFGVTDAVEGDYDTFESAKNDGKTDIKNELLYSTSDGYQVDFDGKDKLFTIFKGEKAIKCRVVVKPSISVTAELENKNGQKIGNSDRFVLCTFDYLSEKKHKIKLDSKYSITEKYNLKLNMGTDDYSADLDYRAITKIVDGYYGSLKKAENAKDIKEELFKGKGYEGVYGGTGKEFTMFVGEEPFHFTIIVESNDKPITPNPSSSDTYFNIFGVHYFDSTGMLRQLDTYRIPYQHDSYYDAGYQTIFYINDNIDLRACLKSSNKNGNKS